VSNSISKNSVFCDITAKSGERKKERSMKQASSIASACQFLVWVTCWSWKWRRYVAPKRISPN
jgi:hypothetical protein